MISVALPTDNGKKYLREQLDSIDSICDILEECQQRFGVKYYVN